MKNTILLYIKTVFALTAVVFCMSSCSDSNPGPTTEELIIGVSQDYRATDIFSHKGFNCLVFETLVKMDANGEFTPLLAESWEKSPDGLQYTFRLKKGVKFSDSSAVTAEKVKESMFYRLNRKPKRSPRGGRGEGDESEKGRPGKPGGRPGGGKPGEGGGRPAWLDDPEINTDYSTFDNRRYNLPKWSSFVSIDVLDEHTIRFNLPRPYNGFLNEIATTHMYPVVKIDESEEVTGYIGTGPYVIGEYVKTQYMTLVPNEHFRDGPANIRTIKLRVIPDPETRAIALQAGEIHIDGYDNFDKIPDQSITLLRDMKNIEVKRLKNVENPSVSYLALNYRKEPFSDIRVRRAVSLALNRSDIEKVISETARILDGPWPEDHRFFNPGIPKTSYDPKRARQLLVSAGWKDIDGDGVVEKNGQPLSVRVTFSLFDPQYKIMAEVIQAQLKAAGIDVKIEVVDLGTHIMTMRNRDYDMAFWPMMRYKMFFYTGHPSWLNVYSSSDLDEAFETYLHSNNKEVMMSGMMDTQMLITESCVFPLFFERFNIVAWNKKVLGDFEPLPIGWDLSINLWQARLK